MTHIKCTMYFHNDIIYMWCGFSMAAETRNSCALCSSDRAAQNNILNRTEFFFNVLLKLFLRIMRIPRAGRKNLDLSIIFAGLFYVCVCVCLSRIYIYIFIFFILNAIRHKEKPAEQTNGRTTWRIESNFAHFSQCCWKQVITFLFFHFFSHQSNFLNRVYDLTHTYIVF